MRCKACDRLLSEHEPDDELCTICYGYVIGMYDDDGFGIGEDVEDDFDDAEIPV